MAITHIFKRRSLRNERCRGTVPAQYRGRLWQSSSVCRPNYILLLLWLILLLLEEKHFGFLGLAISLLLTHVDCYRAEGGFNLGCYIGKVMILLNWWRIMTIIATIFQVDLFQSVWTIIDLFQSVSSCKCCSWLRLVKDIVLIIFTRHEWSEGGSCLILSVQRSPSALQVVDNADLPLATLINQMVLNSLSVCRFLLPNAITIIFGSGKVCLFIEMAYLVFVV